MFKNRKPKIIASYEDDEEGNNDFNTHSNDHKNNKLSSTRPVTTNDDNKQPKLSIFKKKTSLSLKNAGHSTNSSNTRKKRDENSDEANFNSGIDNDLKVGLKKPNALSNLDDVDDLETVVIRPRKQTGFSSKSKAPISSFSSNTKPKSRLQAASTLKPNAFSSIKQTSSYDDSDEDGTVDRQQKTQESTQGGVQLLDDDMDMRDAYIDDDIVNDVDMSGQSSGKKVRFAADDNDSHHDDELPITGNNTNTKTTSITRTLLQPLDNPNEYKASNTVDVPAEDFIPLDPETLSEEKGLLETRLYNEYDMEEGVEMLDEDLALDEQTKERQRRWKRLIMEEAIDATEAEKFKENNGNQVGQGNEELSTGDGEEEDDEDREETEMWEKNQLMSSVVYGHSELEHQKALQKLKSDNDQVPDSKTSSNSGSSSSSSSKPNSNSKSKSKDNTSSDTSLKVPPLPSLTAVLDRVKSTASKMEKKKDELEKEILELKSQVDEIEKKQAETQQKLDEAGKKYEMVMNGDGHNQQPQQQPSNEQVEEEEAKQQRDQDGDFDMN